MVRNFAAALLATTLIASPAFAAQSSDTAGSAPVTQAAPAASTTNAKQSVATKPAKMVEHTAKHARKHFAHRKTGTMHQARHITPAKTHQASVVKSVKPMAEGRARNDSEIACDPEQHPTRCEPRPGSYAPACGCPAVRPPSRSQVGL